MPLLSLYYKWGNRYLERLSNLPKIIQLLSGIAKIWTQWKWQSKCLTITLYKSEEFAYQFSIILLQENRQFGGNIGQHGPVWGSEETRVLHMLCQHTGIEERRVVPGCLTARGLWPTSITAPPNSLSESLRWILSSPPHFIQRTPKWPSQIKHSYTCYFLLLKLKPYEVKTPFHNA